jgi:dolichol-phosphate mannosyltransferase
MRTLGVIIPAHNEQKNISKTIDEIKKLKLKNFVLNILVIDDGSIDKTFDEILKIKKIKYIRFSKNFGKESAMSAGLEYFYNKTKVNAVVILDADGQHPPKYISKMIEKYEKGENFIQAKRIKERGFRDTMSIIFGKLISYFSGLNYENLITDYILIDRKIIKILLDNKSKISFLKLDLLWLGFKSYKIDIKINSRESGNSNFGILKLFELALFSIIYFSNKPLKYIVYFGLIYTCFNITLISFMTLTQILELLVFRSISFIIVLISLFLGISILISGVLALYIGIINRQTSNKNSYIIQENN